LDTQGPASQYGKDINKVYFKGTLLVGADPKTFKIIDHGYGGYSMDEKNLYKEDKLVGKTEYRFNSQSTGKIILDGSWPLSAIFEEGDKANIISSLKISGSGGGYNLSVYKQKIYFIDPEGYLTVFEPSTNLISGINLSSLALRDSDGLSNIVDFYVEKEDIYFLYGVNCNSYLEHCNLDLMKYNSADRSVEKIYSGVTARKIMGIDEENNNLYLSWSDGDAGCFWTSNYMINLNLKTQSKESSIGGCTDSEGDEGGDLSEEYKNAQKELDDYFIKVKDDITKADGVYIKNNIIVLPPVDSNTNFSGAVRYFNN
jgi:hypothetical protein